MSDISTVVDQTSYIAPILIGSCTVGAAILAQLLIYCRDKTVKKKHAMDIMHGLAAELSFIWDDYRSGTMPHVMKPNDDSPLDYTWVTNDAFCSFFKANSEWISAVGDRKLTIQIIESYYNILGLMTLMDQNSKISERYIPESGSGAFVGRGQNPVTLGTLLNLKEAIRNQSTLTEISISKLGTFEPFSQYPELTKGRSSK